MGRKVYTHSFAGGEMSPLMFGHIGDEGYRTGFARGRNLVVMPTGAAMKRPPFAFVAPVKSGVTNARLFPFNYGDGDSYAMEWGPNHVRLFSEGSPIRYATPINVASVDLATDTFTTVSAHGLTINEEVRITHANSSFPGALVAGSTYFIRTIPTPTTFTLSASSGPGALLDLTTSSTIDDTRFWRQAELPRTYVISRQVTRNVNVLDCASAHSLVSTHGDPVHFTTTGTLPAPLGVGTVYYARFVDTDTFSVFPTRADAIANTNQIPLTSAGAGVHTFHYAYYHGDTIWAGNLTVNGSRLFWCSSDLTTSVPNTLVSWHQMPHDGTFEISHGLGSAGLASLNYDQAFDEWSFVATQGPPYNLIRETRTFPSGSSQTADVTIWRFERIQFAPQIAAPTFGATTRDFGEYHSINWGDGAPVATNIATLSVVTPNTVSNILIPGDVVYMEATLGGADAITGVAATPGFFILSNVGQFAGVGNREDLRFLRIDGGTEVTNTSGSDKAGVIRVATSSSRLTESYVVTAINDDNEESVPSAPQVVTNILTVPGSSNTLTWGAVTGASRYRLYKKIDEVYGLIVETEGLTFTDDDIGPDLAFQPPNYDGTLDTEYPAAIANFQQRGCFGGTEDHQRRIWLSRTGTRSTMSYHERLLLDDDRISADIVARERTVIRHIVPMTHLLVMTSAGEIRLTGVNSDVLTPTSKDSRPISQVGCSGVRPIVNNGYLLWVSDRNGRVYEMQPQQSLSISPTDVSIRSSHLVDGYILMQSAQQVEPHEIEWFPRDDGLLLGFTHIPEQNVRGWHVHLPAGANAKVKSVCVIPESDGDRLYAIIEQTINSATVYNVVRMDRLESPIADASLTDLSNCRDLDLYKTYSGSATTTVPDLGHLEGETVYAIADGRVEGPLVVTNATIRLSRAASSVHVGLFYRPELRSMPVAMMVDGFGKGRELNIGEVSVRVDKSFAFQVSAHSDDDAEFAHTPPRATAPGFDRLRARSKDVPVPVEGGWNRSAQVYITQDVPLPLTIVSLTIDVTGGGPP